MQRFILHRLLQLIPVLFFVTVLVFFIVRLAPGDPAMIRMGPRAADSRFAAGLEAMRREMGLDKPVIVQYGIWLRDIASGNFGISARSQQPVMGIIFEKVPASAELIAAGMALALAGAIPLGITAALRHRTIIDTIATLVSLMGIAIPIFWLGLLLLLVFGVRLRWLPTTGFVPLTEDPLENLRHLALPAVSLAAYEMAILTRFLRAQMLEVLRQDYIRTAKAKGLMQRIVVVRHALKNALIPLVTVAGIEVGALIGGTVIIEQVFGWPGIGWLAFQAIANRDYPMLEAIVLLIAVVVSGVNLSVDIIYAYLNPKIRATFEGRVA